MPRSFTYSALALRVKHSGEANREAWFLTSEEGIVKATVFGGARSRLRSQVAPYHEGNLIIYHDPVKDFRKVTDFDVQTWRPGLREVWERVQLAGVLAETVLASQGGGGNWPEALTLTGSVLDALNESPAESCPAVAVWFLWNWAGILGMKPDLSHCSQCGTQIGNDEDVCYSGRKEALFCERCRGEPSMLRISGQVGRGEPSMLRISGQVGLREPSTLIRVNPETRLWLTGIENLSPAALTADASVLPQAVALSLAVLTGAFGRRLATWDALL